MTRAGILPLFLLAACEFADVDTGETGDGTPELFGGYTSEVTSLSGCDGLLDPVPFSGALSISGPSDALVFAWAEFTASGSVDEAFAVSLEGNEQGVTLEADGLATRDASDAWFLDLGFSVDVAPLDTADTAGGCSATGTLEATQESS